MLLSYILAMLASLLGQNLNNKQKEQLLSICLDVYFLNFICIYKKVKVSTSNKIVYKMIK